MKEYKVEVLRNGRWVSGLTRTFATIEDAKKRAKSLERHWIEYVENTKREIKNEKIKNDLLSTVPTDFRIVSREVSAWTIEK